MNRLQKSLKILLLGDSCYDYYHYGNVNRISPEAPIPIFDHLYTQKKLGMASNVRENFSALGIEVDFQTYFFENKNRYIDQKTKQQLLRVDQKISDKGRIPRIIHSINEYQCYDAIVFSDYNKGFVSHQDIQKIRDVFEGPIFVDTKKPDLARLGDCFFKINEEEHSKLVSHPPLNNLIVTFGDKKVTWGNRLYTPPKVEAYDVCGAGDTFLAALVFEFLHKNDMEQAILFAMKAAAITVQKIGVYAPTLKEIEDDNKT